MELAAQYPRNTNDGPHARPDQARYRIVSMIFGSRKNLSSEINVTPLIDVLLVLLIIFMVLLPQHHFGEAAEIPIPSPEPSPPDASPIVIEILDAGEDQLPSLRVNRQHLAWDSLEKYLEEIHRLRPTKVMFVSGDPGINFQYVAEVLDTSHRAGVDRVGLIGKRQDR